MLKTWAIKAFDCLDDFLFHLRANCCARCTNVCARVWMHLKRIVVNEQVKVLYAHRAHICTYNNTSSLSLLCILPYASFRSRTQGLSDPTLVRAQLGRSRTMGLARSRVKGAAERETRINISRGQFVYRLSEFRFPLLAYLSAWNLRVNRNRLYLQLCTHNLYIRRNLKNVPRSLWLVSLCNGKRFSNDLDHSTHFIRLLRNIT